MTFFKTVFVDYGAISFVLFLLLFIELKNLFKVKKLINKLIHQCELFLSVKTNNNDNDLVDIHSLSIYELSNKLQSFDLSCFIKFDYFTNLYSSGTDFQKLFAKDLQAFHQLLISINSDNDFFIHTIHSFVLISSAIILLSLGFDQYNYRFSGVIMSMVVIIVLFLIVFKFATIINYLPNNKNIQNRSLQHFQYIQNKQQQKKQKTPQKQQINIFGKNYRLVLNGIFFRQQIINTVLVEFWKEKTASINYSARSLLYSSDFSGFYKVLCDRNVQDKNLARLYSLFHIMIAVSIVIMFLLDNIQILSSGY